MVKQTKKFISNYFVLIILFAFSFTFLVNINSVFAQLSDVQQTQYWDLTAELQKLEAKKAAEALKSVASFDAVGLEAKILEIKGTIAKLEAIQETENQGFFKQFTQWAENWASEASWSKAFQSALSSSLNTLAFDTATWLGSGGKGQKPMFVTEGWDDYLANIADNAAGTMIEEFGKVGGEQKFNLCSPDLAVKIKIGLGLTNMYSKKTPACTFSKLKENWEKELNSKDFLNSFQDMFSPTSNDFGIALTTQTGLFEKQNALTEVAGKELQAKKGWLDVTSVISKNTISPPDNAERTLGQTIALQTQNYAKYTGNALMDAANIFINQLAITAFNKFMNELGQDKDPTTSAFDWSRLTNFNSGPSNNGGIIAIKERLSKIIKPNFTTRGDYNILSELVQCPKPTNAGPTNCVIEDKFRQAIQQKKTVGEAMDDNSLDGSLVFGFKSQLQEPDYLTGYPYRSMVILRKFRIIPVGWELAAQYINTNIEDVSDHNTLADMVACFDPSDGYVGYDKSWCHGLVDPSWVLKAPLNYCGKEGPGPEITSSSISGSGADSYTSITRNDKYCADERSCIKENSDGTCKQYGYCTEEKRQWKFGGDSCDPINNSCESFKQETGGTVAYLKDTINYDGCTSDNAGCTAYCTDYDNGTGKFNCTASSTNDKIYLNRNAESCKEDVEGCRGLIRTKEDLGTNLLVNSSFEEVLTNGGWNVLGATTTESYDGAAGLKLNTGASTKTLVVGPDGADRYDIAGEAYALSFFAKNCSSSSTYKIDSEQTPINFLAGAGWQSNKTSYIYNNYGNAITISFNLLGSDTNCAIDAIKLEKGRTASSYNEYGQKGLVYEKLAPEYLRCNSASPAPECVDFANKCSLADVGCEMYTSQTDASKIPAKATTKDYCVEQCVGFDTFIQSETTFDTLRPENFIAKSAKSCNAQAVGCDEFTNLDKVVQGGEAKEYYSYLRQCVKSSDGTCADFYSWEGSNESGYQLKVVTLKGGGIPDASGAYSEPFLTQTEGFVCSTKLSDTNYNANCREFYGKNGFKSFHLYNNTVSCSDNCHPYRRTEKNIVKDAQGINIPSVSACQGISMFQTAGSGQYKDINYSNGECLLCKNGGTYDSPTGACLYNAIPNEGMSCSVNDNGCREYTGNTGQNVRIVLANDFEDNTTQGWLSSGGTATLSTEAITLNGKSLHVASVNSVNLPVPNLIQQNKAYVLSFIAKSDGNLSLSATLSNGVDTDVFATTSQLKTSWQLYEISLPSVNHTPSATEVFSINATNNSGFYIDNIKLTEISDRYYLIKNSWTTPDVCHQDINGNPYANYMLGCDAYKDRESKLHYLRSFSYLCKESSVGCELMIDTQNSISPYGKDFNASVPVNDEVTVPADKYIYAVYDKTKECKEEDKGCELLGKPYTYRDTNGDTNIYESTYLKNKPDDYDSGKKIMCTIDATFCKEYITESGAPEYFKDPGDQTCEWRQGFQASWAWYKKRINRCGGSGDVCLADKDCLSGVTCQKEAENVDVLCATDSTGLPKTIGQGNARVVQPIKGWAGVCPTEQAGCTELIDPMSDFSANLIFNSNLSDIDNDTVFGDGWLAGKQEIKIEPLTLYRLAGKALSGNLSVSCDQPIIEFSSINNTLFNTTNSISFPLVTNLVSRSFYSDFATNCEISIPGVSATATDVYVELKKVIVNHQKVKELDTTSCNGSVNVSNGCILFNKRSITGSNGWSRLINDADLKKPEPIAATSLAEADSNLIIKVTPDRVCDKWLSCNNKVTYTNEQGKADSYCSSIVSCNQTSENGDCLNMLTEDSEDQTTLLAEGLPGNMANLSGYSKVGYTRSTENEMKGNYPISQMTQIGDSAEVPNGNFELFSSDLRPSGWMLYDAGEWTENKFKVITNPVFAQAEGIRYPMEGKSFLRVGTDFGVKSDAFPSNNQSEYVLSANINTKSLSNGFVVLQVIDASGQIASTSLAYGADWTLKTLNFDHFFSPLTVNLYSTGDAGYFYADEVKIRPTITSRENWKTDSSCRLFPESSSLSCSYFGDSGYQYKGWYGYCLQYDRAPGDPNTCLLWWPGDRVKGDDLTDENVGYQGPAPLYYCLQAEALIPVVRLPKMTNVVSGSCYAKTCQFTNIDGDTCPADYAATYTVTYGGRNGGVGHHSRRCTADIACVPSGTFIANDPNNDSDPLTTDYAWYSYEGHVPVATNITTLPNNTCGSRGAMTMVGGPIEIPQSALKFYDPLTATDPLTYGFYEDKIAYCKTVAMTVTESGNNMYWSGRVYEGSDYVMPLLPASTPILGYKYDTGLSPFGRINPPVSTDPVNWDGFNGTNKTMEPVYITGFLDKTGFANSAHGGNPFDLEVNTTFPTGSTFNTISSSMVVTSDTATTSIETSVSATSSPTNKDYCVASWTDADPNDEIDPVPVFTTALNQLCTITTEETVFATTTVNVYTSGALPVNPNIGFCGNSGEMCLISTGTVAIANKTFECSANDTCQPFPVINRPTRGKELLQNIFAKAYGAWTWSTTSRKYEITNLQSWDSPNTICPVNVTTSNRDACAFKPVVNNIKTNDQNADNTIVNMNGFVKLSFNSTVDLQQRPLKLYSVDWGDGTKTTISGLNISDKSDPENPHILFHLYNYWDLSRKYIARAGLGNLDCATAGICTIKPKVMIQDNWGWCNGDTVKGACNFYESFAHSIVVKQ